jgi:5-hydroxyisourate hydrolase
MATASLSTHVLDTGAGRPASGVAVELSAGGRLIASTQTDGDGRAHLADDLEAGLYRLTFAPPSPFFRRVELEIELADGHYHVPLLVSPYSCASYRGS